MKVLDLFSGIGGFSLGLERTGGFETVAFCEIDPYAQQVLRKHWPEVPIYDDVRELTAERLAGDGIRPDIITGGFPCQPFSTAGKQRGKDDDRHLWPEMYRLIQECRPSYVIGENVAGFISLGLDDVLFDLEAVGYTARSIVIPACAVGRDHWRQRVWILAYPMPGVGQMGRNASRVWRESEQIPWYGMGEEKTPPRVVGGFDGIPSGLDRIRCLGNSVVPQIPELIGRAILERAA